MPLNNADPLYVQLRDLNFAVVGGLLSQVARRIHEDYEVALLDMRYGMVYVLTASLCLGKTSSQNSIPNQRFHWEIRQSSGGTPVLEIAYVLNSI